MCEMPSCRSARNVIAIALTAPGGSTTRSARARTEGSSKRVRSSEAITAGGPTCGQVATISPSVIVCRGFGLATSRSGWKSMSYRPRQRSTAARPNVRCLHSASREEDRACEERERVRDQAGSRLEQPLTRVERGLEDLFLERFVADDLGNQQVGRFRQLDLPRPAGDERHPVLHPVHLEDPLRQPLRCRSLRRRRRVERPLVLRPRRGRRSPYRCRARRRPGGRRRPVRPSSHSCGGRRGASAHARPGRPSRSSELGLLAARPGRSHRRAC